MAFSLTEGQVCHWDLYRDEGVYVPNVLHTSLLEGETAMKYLWFTLNAHNSRLEILVHHTLKDFY